MILESGGSGTPPNRLGRGSALQNGQARAQLAHLFREGVIDMSIATERASNPEELKRILGVRKAAA